MLCQCSKLWPCSNTDILRCQCFKICIAYVCAPYLQSIEFSKKEKNTKFTQGHNTRIHTVIWYICKMSISNQSSLVSTIMLDIIELMDSDDLVPRGWVRFVALILEDLVGFHRCKFKLGGILP